MLIILYQNGYKEVFCQEKTNLKQVWELFYKFSLPDNTYCEGTS